MDSTVAAATEGAEDAWQTIVTTFTPMLRGMARQYRLNDADLDEVVQSTWARCYECIGQLREPTALPSWLLTTCRRECLSIYRKHGRSVLVGDEVLEMVNSAKGDTDIRHIDPADVVVVTELSQVLHHLVDELPPQQRKVVNELMHRSDSYLAVSRQLDVPIGSIGPTRQRAILRLRHGFQQHGVWAA